LLRRVADEFDHRGWPRSQAADGDDVATVPWRAATDLQWTLTSCSANILIVGATGATIMPLLRTSAPEPSTVLRDELPHPRSGLYVITDATSLSQAQQRVLIERLQAGDHPRIVTLSPVALHPRVLAGIFDETLYYRLNAVMIDLTAPTDPLP
jgi:hypothetical protein